jgi:N4-gp56 family major capsid protein
MADAYVNQAATDFSQLVWSQALLWPLRDELVFDAVATQRSTTENMRGKSVTFTFPNDIAVQTADLDEVVNPDAITMTDSTVNIALKEKGATMISTALARATGFVDLDEVLLNLVGFNAGSSLDTIAATALTAGSNKQYQETLANDAALTSAKTLTTKTLEQAKANLRRNNVGKINGNYWLFLHPNQLLDLRLESGVVSWRQPREQGGLNGYELVNGMEGEWAGFNLITTNREPFTADAGSGGTVMSTRPLHLVLTVLQRRTAMLLASDLTRRSSSVFQLTR